MKYLEKDNSDDFKGLLILMFGSLGLDSRMASLKSSEIIEEAKVNPNGVNANLMSTILGMLKFNNEEEVVSNLVPIISGVFFGGNRAQAVIVLTALVIEARK